MVFGRGIQPVGQTGEQIITGPARTNTAYAIRHFRRAKPVIPPEMKLRNTPFRNGGENNGQQ